jgi:hypothetical protein
MPVRWAFCRCQMIAAGVATPARTPRIPGPDRRRDSARVHRRRDPGNRRATAGCPAPPRPGSPRGPGGGPGPACRVSCPRGSPRGRGRPDTGCAGQFRRQRPAPADRAPIEDPPDHRPFHVDQRVTRYEEAAPRIILRPRPGGRVVRHHYRWHRSDRSGRSWPVCHSYVDGSRVMAGRVGWGRVRRVFRRVG